MDLIDPSTLPTVTRDGEPVKNPYCSHRDKRGQSTHAYCPASRPQYEFHQSGAKEVFYGGAAGGGKTITMLVEGLRWVAFSSYRAIFFRRTYVELSQVVELSQEIFPAYGGQWVESKMMWRFPSGARYYLAYLEKDGDKLRYQGKAFHYIAFDELTQWPTEGGYKYLFTRNRPFRPDPTGFTIPCFMRAGSNPGGPGHGWVKKRFIDNSVPYDGRMIRSANGRFYERVYIPATLDDNQILLKSGGGDYETSIMSVADESLRKALRYGDWNIAAGAIFEELRANVHRVRRGGKDAFTGATVAADWAYAGEAVALWIETDQGIGTAPKSRVYREWCTTQTHPSVWAAGVVARSTDQTSGEVVVKRVVLDSCCLGYTSRRRPESRRTDAICFPESRNSSSQGAEGSSLDSQRHRPPSLVLLVFTSRQAATTSHRRELPEALGTDLDDPTWRHRKEPGPRETGSPSEG
jgi:hypothetical protein